MAEEEQNDEEKIIKVIEVSAEDLLNGGEIEIETGKETHLIIELEEYTFSE